MKESTKQTAAVNIFEATLRPLLKILGWIGNERDIVESLPYYSKIHSVISFCQVMEYLGYDHYSLHENLSNLDPRLLPCLFVKDDDNIFILIQTNWIT